MKFKIKDRVKLASGDKKVKGTIVKVFYNNKTKQVRTCGILWDNDWPRDGNSSPRIFYAKPEDIEYVGTWSLD